MPGFRSAQSVLIFSSTHHMLRAEQVLLRAGLDIELVPAPKGAGELCTTAICFYTDLDRQVRDLLASSRIEVRDVMPFRRPHTAQRIPGLKEIAGMLDASGPGAQAILAEAERVTERAFGSRVSLMAVVGLDGAGVREASEMGIPLLLIPISGGEYNTAGLKPLLEDGRFIATAVASSLDSALVEDLSACGVHYFLAGGSRLPELSSPELAEELLFLRDNRPGLVATGSLLPLLEGDAGGFRYDLAKAVLLAAVARLVMPDAFIPAPSWIWRGDVPGCCNLMIVDSAGGDLRAAVLQLQDLLRQRGRRLPAVVEERCS